MIARLPGIAGLIVLASCAGQHAAPPAPTTVLPAIARGTTFCNPLDIDYRFALDTPTRRDAADPLVVLFGDEYYLFASNSGGYWHSSDLRQWELIEPRGLPLDAGAKSVFVRDGRLYYAASDPATVYTTDEPRGGTWHAVPAITTVPGAGSGSALAIPSSPFAAKRGGFLSSVGASSAFVDRAGNRWRVMTLGFAASDRRERRLGIFAAGRDSSGGERIDGYLGDYPQFLPGVVADPLDHNATGWTLLSARKRATASSTLAAHAPALAFDEDGSTWWSAATGGVGEWLAVDLGAIARVAAVQVNFAEEGAHASGRGEDNYQQYLIESSLDGVRWTTRIDESSSTRDSPHHYVQLDSARNARFVRITNIHAAAGGTFSIRELRIFGRGPVAPPAEPLGLAVQRGAGGRIATVRWKASARATGYVVRFGTSPGTLHGSQQAGLATEVGVDGLEPGTRYWFSVDAIGEGGVTRGRTTKEG